MKSALVATHQRPCSLTSVPDPSSNASNECVMRCARYDAVSLLRMYAYPDLPLRFIKIHGDILVS